VNLLLKLRADLECRNKPFFKGHGVAGAGIACHPWLAALDAEHAKATQLNAFAFGKRIDDAQQKAINDGLGLELCQTRFAGDLIDDVGFRDVQRGLVTDNSKQYSEPESVSGNRVAGPFLRRTANIRKALILHNLSPTQ